MNYGLIHIGYHFKYVGVLSTLFFELQLNSAITDVKRQNKFIYYRQVYIIAVMKIKRKYQQEFILF